MILLNINIEMPEVLPCGFQAFFVLKYDYGTKSYC